ncbi:ATP-binding protein [Aquincola sp. MAHUQ-54]|uniref:C4-dicarboxylate transport sensor protein DctB n=1 Tax=Aquincola agrisoli TaxID=3119538 RepID=A0AAW9QCQ0_9BURK
MKRFRTLGLLLLAALAAALVAAAVIGAHAAGRRAALERLDAAAQHRLDMIASSLDSELARFDYLPSVLEMTPSVLDLLERPADAALRDEVNRYLRGVNATAGADMLYVVDRRGVALAGADWDQPGTPVGHDLSFRPYVRAALADGRGRFYGVGVTSRRPGYYLSFALTRRERLLGLATVKVRLADAEQAWRRLPGQVMVLDENGVVVLSTQEVWRFRPLAPLPDTLRTEIERGRPYGDASLTPLDWRPHDAGHGGAQGVSLHGVRYIVAERRMQRTGWRILVLDEMWPVVDQARTLALAAGMGSLAMLMALAIFWLRRRTLRQRLANQAALQVVLKAARDNLEAKVQERTAELRAAQSELMHAEKMAALGQMSAGIVHELNQPLAAMRTMSDNALVLLERGKAEDLQYNLSRIGQLVDRLGRLTQQLKGFAHKGPPVLAPVAVHRVLQDALLLVQPRLRTQGVVFEQRIDPPDLQVLADGLRLEQVLVNLLGNAIDAMAGSPERRLCFEAVVREGRCRITVSDSGPGIAEEILPRLFEPFATSKPAGAGLGLGLTISAHIVRELGGTLRGGNRAGGGAAFTLELPLAAESRHG